MVCYSPLRGYKILNQKTENGKELILFNESDVKGKPYIIQDMACSQCIGCRIDRSREWALRIMNEASMYEYNCFITLTYDDEHLSESGCLNKKHFQNFMKEIRRKYIGKTRNNGKNMPEKINKIRFFHCGEYGIACNNCGYHPEECYCGNYSEGLGRPHHHAILFNFDFPDKVLEATEKGKNHYSSEILAKLWKKGIHDIGEVEFSSAAYVARYVLKKVNGERQKEHYKRYDYRTNKVYKVIPEYITMSRRPGIGKQWFDIFKYTDCYPKDFITVDGKVIKVPKYYDKMLEEIDPKLMEKVKRERRLKATEKPDEHTVKRLLTKRMIKTKQIETLGRKL